jgi:hypothetical protein
MIDNEEKSAFSVNIPLTDEDLFNLRKIIKDFIQEKAMGMVSNYRPEAHQVVAGGLILKGAFIIEIPDKEDFDKVLDLVKKAPDEKPESKTRNLITISLPIISTPTGKRDD